MSRTWIRAVVVSTAFAASASALARPISYAGGHMLMADHQSDMDQWSYAYSPSFRWSASLGELRLDETGGHDELTLRYVRASRLLKRWNLPAAQANVFVWGGLGQVDLRHGSSGSARHVGFQADYETRRIYTSFVSELHEGTGGSRRFDTASIGWAPYEHDIDRMAAWIVVKGLRTSDAVDDPIKGATMLRLFTPRWWLEAGVDTDGQPLGNIMINF
jgi:hypothetical protein